MIPSQAQGDDTASVGLDHHVPLTPNPSPAEGEGDKHHFATFFGFATWVAPP